MQQPAPAQAAAAAAASQQQSGAAGAGAGPSAAAAAPLLVPQHDVPVFLQRQKGIILNTGKYLNVMRQCQAKPPRTLPLGTHLGEWPTAAAGRGL
jgi:hypothetical protein